MRCLVALALWVAASPALAGTPDYDAFSEPDGEIAAIRQESAAWLMLRDPERLEAVYADAMKGMPRAVHIVRQLEATLAASGREVAERSSRPGCLVPGYKELSGTCRPDWSFLDFLSKERPGGIRLREVIFGAFAARARERGLENQAVLAAVNGLLSLELARGVLLKAETAASAPKVAGGGPTRVINGVRVVDRGTGTVLEGPVDLKPTLDRIASGGRFPHRNDGAIFENRPLPGRTTPELPVKPPGYYREYVHPTPGVSGPGPQRIVVGQGGEMYYTPDHYQTFILLR